MALTIHLWTGGDAPVEWVEYQLCSMFHKLPSELAAESYEDMRSIMTCIAVENRVRERRRQVDAQRPGGMKRLH